MLRICKLLVPYAPSNLRRLSKPLQLPLSYSFPQYFSSSKHKLDSGQSILSLESMVDNNILEESKDFLQRLPREESASFQRIFDKYKSIKELNLLKKEEIYSLIDLFSLIGSTYFTEDQDSSLSIKYFLKVADMFESGLVEKNVGYALNNISICTTYYRMGDLEKSEEYAQKAITYVPNADEKVEFQLLLVNSMTLSAMIKSDKGQLGEALKEFEDAVPIISNIPKEEQSAFFKSVYQDIANIYKKRNEIQLVIDSYKHGIDKILEHLGQETVDVAELYFRLAEVLATIKEFDQALEYGRKAVVVNSKYNGSPSWIEFEVLNIQRSVYYQKADYQKCLKCCKEVLKIMKVKPSLNKQPLVNTYFDMTAVFLAQKNYPRAQKHYKLALNELEDLCPKDSRELANMYLEYAKTLKERASPEHMNEPKELYTKASQVFAKLEDIKGEICTINSLGQIASLMGDYDESLQHFEHSLAKLIDSEMLQDEAETTHGWLSRLYLRKAQLSQSARHGIKAIELCEKNQNATKQRDEYYYTLGEAYEQSGDFYKAEMLYQELLDLTREEKNKDGEKGVSVVMEHIKRVLKKQGKNPEAVDVRSLYRL